MTARKPTGKATGSRKAAPSDGTHRRASEPQHLSRAEAFRELARRRAAGEILVPPTMLADEERRLYIRQTLLEDHEFRVANRPEGAQSKFDKLAESAFKFFRGTALLYYRDQAGTDADLPAVLAIGDVHPENFGVMPNEDGAPFFGIDDFDEAYLAPFSWDVKRGAVGFVLSARENGFSKKARRRVVRAWVAGYFEGLREFARSDRESWHQFRLDNSPPMIGQLLKRSLGDRREFLSRMVDLEKEQFLATDEIVPYSPHVEEFQAAVDQYRKTSEISGRGRGGHFKVKDVAVKKGSGTASLGLDRYLVLLDGETDDAADDIILEIKQARRSALHGLTPHDADSHGGEAERVVRSHTVHMAGGDPYYGVTTLDGRSFLVRERSPFKNDIDVDELDEAGMREYARICAFVLAQAHARSDADHDAMQGEAEQQILDAVREPVFTADMIRFAEATAKRVRRDYALFRMDHALGAYRLIESL